MEKLMNCFLLLFLLSCCGWGNGCSCNSSRSSCGCRMEQRGGCRDTRAEMSGRECRGSMDSRRNDSCGRDMGRQAECCECKEEGRGCGCEEERRGHGSCGCEEDNHDHGGCSCMERENTSDGPGMIPPPWQEYPKFPRRDRGEECDG